LNQIQKKVITESEIIFIAVGTPQDKKGKADLLYVKKVARVIGENINENKIIVNKSTVPLGTADLVKKIINKEQEKRKVKIEFSVVSNPEFLAEGNAIKDFYKERIVIGTDSKKAQEKLKELYLSTNKNRQILCTDNKSAEIIKYANNCMLALRLSFINEVSQLCDKTGANIEAVSNGIGLDDRIGNKFLKSSLGYGGSCFPKDIRAFVNTMKEQGCEPNLINGIEKVNKKQLEQSFLKIKKLVKKIEGKSICFLGLAFKANTDDIRESPSIELIKMLLSKGAKIKAYDPKANQNTKKILPTISFFENPYKAIENCEALVIATDWKEFETLDFEKIKKIMKQPKIFDGRNIYSPEKMRSIGFEYLSIGRK
jgi:UDPglucose 6-dehydrogenase